MPRRAVNDSLSSSPLLLLLTQAISCYELGQLLLKTLVVNRLCLIYNNTVQLLLEHVLVVNTLFNSLVLMLAVVFVYFV